LTLSGVTNLTEREVRQEKNAIAFFDLISLLRRTLASSSHPRGSDEPLGPRHWGIPRNAITSQKVSERLKKNGTFITIETVENDRGIKGVPLLGTEKNRNSSVRERGSHS
jgi:hypothetical protein